MHDLIARVRFILRAAPLWLTGAAVALTIVNEELAAVLPSGAAEDVGTVVVTVVAWLTAAVNIIRRVTPVAAGERGLTP